MDSFENKEQSDSKLPRNTIMFCEKRWQLPVLTLALLVLLTFAWGFYIVGSFQDDDFFEDSYDLSAPEFLFRNMAGSGFPGVVEGVAPGIVGLGGTGANLGAVAAGTIVSPKGHVLTALHSVKGLASITAYVRTPGGLRQYRAEVVKSLPEHNLVLLKLISPDRFLFFPLVDTTSLPIGERVAGIGFGANGSTIFREGRVLQMNSNLAVGGLQVSHLIRTDAIYTWEQNGGPIVNSYGELIGINMSIVGENGVVGGYAIPAHVIMADFGDVIRYKMAPPRAAPPVGARHETPGEALNAALPAAGADTQNSMAWWTRARARVGANNPPLGVNVAAPNTRQGVAPGTAGIAAPAFAAGNQTNVDTDHIGRNRIGGYLVGDIVGLAMLAVVVGVASGMMTMGGGVLHVAGLMIFFGYGMHLIRPVVYLTSVFIFGAAMRRNSRAGMVSWDTVRAVAPWAVVGVLGGYFIGNALDESAIAVLLGLFAVLMTFKGLQEILYHDGADVMLRASEDDGTEEALGGASPGVCAPIGVDSDMVDEKDDLTALEDMITGASTTPDSTTDAILATEMVKLRLGNVILGLPAGLFSGILGISGGVIAVPMQRFLARMPLQRAIANSSVIVFWASLAGAIVSFLHGVPSGLIEWQAPLSLAAIMIPGAYAGGIIGAKLMKELPVIALKWFYTIIMAAIAAKMMFLN